jgi:hypothetical protein
MIETLISSKTRIKLLVKFFLNSKVRGYLRGLEEEFGENSNAIRVELNRFEDVGMIESKVEGNKKIFAANVKHPLFKDIHSIVKKYIGLDAIIEHIVTHLGEVEKVYLTGSFAAGINGGNIVDLEFVGNLNTAYLTHLITKTEPLISKKIRYVVYSKEEYKNVDSNSQKRLLIWTK